MKKNSKRIALTVGIILLLSIVIRKCSFHRLPKEKFTTSKIDVQHKLDNDLYHLTIKNLLECPNRVFLSSTDKDISELIGNHSSLVLEAKGYTTISFPNREDLKDKINIKFKWGDSNLPVKSSKLERLPFSKQRSYELMQGNNSNPTHNHDGSRYAFDFAMKIGDTITSAQNGFVVSTIDGYKGWGYGKKWNSFGNQVMIYDSSSNLFTLYGHLKHNGSLVEIGQSVKIGQPIALSGKTGRVQEEHLHFNVFRADDSKGGITSFRLDSIGKYKVSNLKRYQLMEN